jgi:hypothetical protein
MEIIIHLILFPMEWKESLLRSSTPKWTADRLLCVLIQEITSSL